MESSLFELRNVLLTGLPVGLLQLNPHIKLKTSFKGAEECFCLSLAEPLTTFLKPCMAGILVSFEASLILSLFHRHTNIFLKSVEMLVNGINYSFQSYSFCIPVQFIHWVLENEAPR